MRTRHLRLIAAALAVVGLILLALGVAYLAIPADKLPSIMGRLAGSTVPRSKRGLAAAVASIACLVGAGIAVAKARARRAARH